MTEVQRECSVVAIEEMAELTKVLCKIQRFGIDDVKRADMIAEIGDVQCMINLLCDHYNISYSDVNQAVMAKREKLTIWSDLI